MKKIDPPSPSSEEDGAQVSTATFDDGVWTVTLTLLTATTISGKKTFQNTRTGQTYPEWLCNKYKAGDGLTLLLEGHEHSFMVDDKLTIKDGWI